MKNQILLGDCLDRLKDIPDNSIDSIVTDPPYELGFMGKSWDNTGIAYNVEMWKECLRILKPGGHLLSFSATRTYHRMAVAIEDAGFEIRDMIEWVYGSGFPKSLNIGKSIENKLLTGNASKNGFHKLEGERREGRIGMYDTVEEQGFRKVNPDQLGAFDLEPTTDEAKQWNGWGTALKPAHEPICMARKPLSEKTVAENVLKWGTGGINIDESRIDVNPEVDDMHRTVDRKKRDTETWEKGSGFKNENNSLTGVPENGRFPANLIHDGSEEVTECFPEQKSGAMKKPYEYVNNGYSLGKPSGSTKQIHDSSSGNASRFFKSIIYQAKASKSERNKGCETLNEKQTTGGGGGIGNYLDDVNSASGKYGSEKAPSKNHHPTVKPIALMEYLIKMVTPKNGIVLDPFGGSGTTGIASKKNGFDYLLIEREPEYIEIAKARIEAVTQKEPTLFD